MGYVWKRNFKGLGLKAEAGEPLEGEQLEKARGTLRYLKNKGFIEGSEDQVEPELHDEEEAQPEESEPMDESLESEEVSEEESEEEHSEEEPSEDESEDAPKPKKKRKKKK